MARKRPVTLEDVNEFAEWLGIQLLPYQKELILRYSNHEYPIYLIPRRADGSSMIRAYTQFLATMFDAYKETKEGM